MLKSSSDVSSLILWNIWNSKISGKQNFRDNLKLADLTPIYIKKKDPTIAENYRTVSVPLSISKFFERIIQKQFSSYKDEFLSTYLFVYRKGFNTQMVFLSLNKKRRKNATTKPTQARYYCICQKHLMQLIMSYLL